MDKINECIKNSLSNNLAAHVEMLHVMKSMDDFHTTLEILSESQPAFYMDILYRFGTEEFGYEDKRKTFAEECKEDAENYTAYCIGVNLMHQKMQTEYGRGNLTFEIDLSSEFNFTGEEPVGKYGGNSPQKSDGSPTRNNSMASRRYTGLGRPTFEYEGETLKGKAHGFGTAKGVSEDVIFEGSWIEGMPEGFCKAHLL